jgi:hypothetical protein
MIAFPTQGEVRKLCTKSKITLQITVNEQEDQLRENKERMIYQAPEEKVRIDQFNGIMTFVHATLARRLFHTFSTPTFFMHDIWGPMLVQYDHHF